MHGGGVNCDKCRTAKPIVPMRITRAGSLWWACIDKWTVEDVQSHKKDLQGKHGTNKKVTVSLGHDYPYVFGGKRLYSGGYVGQGGFFSPIEFAQRRQDCEEWLESHDDPKHLGVAIVTPVTICEAI